MKLKIFGKIKMKKTNLNLKRLEILRNVKKNIIINGWNDNIFSIITKESKYNEEEVRALFSQGYKSLLELYLFNADQEMIKACNKIDLIRMKIHERIREIILIKLKISTKDKNLVKITFFTLMLPQHFNIATYSLYRTVDHIWYIAGDNSTDFNFYTKRLILAGIYSSTIFYWLNGDKTFEQIKDFLNNQLKQISKIPKIKEQIKSTINILPKSFSFAKNFSRFRQ